MSKTTRRPLGLESQCIFRFTRVLQVSLHTYPYRGYGTAQRCSPGPVGPGSGDVSGSVIGESNSWVWDLEVECSAGSTEHIGIHRVVRGRPRFCCCSSAAPSNRSGPDACQEKRQERGTADESSCGRASQRERVNHQANAVLRRVANDRGPRFAAHSPIRRRVDPARREVSQSATRPREERTRGQVPQPTCE